MKQIASTETLVENSPKYNSTLKLISELKKKTLSKSPMV